MYFLLFALLLIALLGCIFFHCHRKKIICKVSGMDCCTKCSLLDELAYPFGYRFHCDCGFFSSTVDAPQKQAGYTWLYDYMAPRFQMVFDALPVYFDYRGRTWLIEFWKGQYGINTGAEIGIYHADTIIPKADYKKTLFSCADTEEMLDCSFQLCNCKNECISNTERHWWLTAFLVGCFSAFQFVHTFLASLLPVEKQNFLQIVSVGYPPLLLYTRPDPVSVFLSSFRFPQTSQTSSFQQTLLQAAL